MLEDTLMEAPQELRLGALRIVVAWKAGSISKQKAARLLTNHMRSWDKIPVTQGRIWYVGPHSNRVVKNTTLSTQ